ncbi:MMPL family transporter [uncultured Albimonas sp.]|uniref:MMPL family transporter n=1 Tax=uncultured Albimonas sp. TaxID=1331701 RepID=UPI0030EF299E|tara:strand:+ start:6263 stop:8995 length:2733 start_codon:yes stop_codon:yes gene_type:complete
MLKLVQRIGDWIVRRPFGSMAILLVFVLGFAAGLPGLKVDTSASGLIVADAPETLKYRQIKETFGDDVAFTIVFDAPDVFTPAILTAIDDAAYEIEGLDGISKVVSLASVSNLRGSEGVLNTDQLMRVPPETAEEAAALRADALGNLLLRGEVVNADGTATAIQAFVETRPGDGVFEKRLSEEIEAILDAQRARLGEEVEIYLSGAPMLKVAILDNIAADGQALGPLALAAITVVLLFFFRAGVAILLPAVTGILSIVTALGFMALLGFAINPVSVIIPTLLLIIGATEDIHLVAEFGAGVRRGLPRPEAVRAMMRHSSLAIVLTSVTTLFGFLTLAPHPIPMIGQFGVGASFGIAANFLITVLITPHLLRVMPTPRAFQRPEIRMMRRVERALTHLALRRRNWVLAAAAVVTLGAGWASTRVVVDNDFLAFFRESDPVRQRIEAQNRDLSGTTVTVVEVDTGQEGGLKDPRTLQSIARLTDFLRARDADVIGYDLFMRKTHQEMNGGDPAFFAIPDSADLIAQYTLLMAPRTLERFVDFDMSRTVILVRSHLAGSAEIVGERPVIQAFAEREMSRDLTVTVSGEAVLVAASSDTMSREIVTNLAYVFGAVFVVISLLFASLRAGLTAMLPNAAPIVINFAAMGLLDIPLGTATFPVAVIALGVAVDDTIHFMSRYSQELRTSESNEEAIARTIEQELQPVFATSMALCAGFMVLSFANFASIAQFGILAAIVMLAAMITDLTLTPALLVMTPLVTVWDLIRVRLSGDFAERSALFRGMRSGEIRRVAALGRTLAFEPGEVILEQGAPGRDMHLLLDGRVEVLSVRPGQPPRRLAEVGAGSVVGEMAFLTGDLRTASVVAATRVETLQISAVTLDRIRTRHRRIAAKLYYNISVILTERLRNSNEAQSTT